MPVTAPLAMLKRLLVYFLLMLPGLAFGCGPYTVAFYDMGLLFKRQPDGSWDGADKDVVDEIARRTGCVFAHRVESRVRIWTMIMSDKLDMTVSGVATPEREVHATFIPYMGGRNLVLLHQDVDAGIKTLDDFARAPRYTVAVVKGFRHGPAYDAWIAGLRRDGRVYDASDVTAMARLLQLGRVHAVVASNLQPEVNTPGWRVMDWAPQDNIISGLAVSKKRVKPEDTARFAAALKTMRQDGTLEGIYRRRMGPAMTAILMQY
jgi:polar amino acid transport system substrate-binding protein